MKRTIVSLLSISLATAALADTPIDATLDARGADVLDVQNAAGTVTVTGTDGTEVRITGRLSDNAERLDFRRDGDRIVVHVILRESNDGRRQTDGTTLSIAAPRDMSVEAQTVSASITTDAMRGEQELASVSGGIDTTLYDAEITAESVSGRIHVAGSRARAEVSSVSGRVELEGTRGELIVQTVSGSIDIESPMLDRGDVRSVSGGIDIEATLATDARLSASSTSGHIALELHGNAAGRYEVSSVSGTIDNCFGPTPERPQFGPPTSTLRFEEGDSDARIDVTSMSGSISLCRKP